MSRNFYLKINSESLSEDIFKNLPNYMIHSTINADYASYNSNKKFETAIYIKLNSNKFPVLLIKQSHVYIDNPNDYLFIVNNKDNAINITKKYNIIALNILNIFPEYKPELPEYIEQINSIFKVHSAILTESQYKEEITNYLNI